MNFNIIVTSKCNLRCKYCYEGNNKSHRDMNIDTANKAIDFIANMIAQEETNRRNRVVFHGGEPMLNFGLIKFIKSRLDKIINGNYAIDYMTTINGTILNDEMIDFIKQNNIFLSISIDGTKEIHNQNRIYHDGKGSYSILIENLKKLNQNGIMPRARMTYKSSNVSSLYESLVSIANLGFEVCVPIADFYDDEWTEEKIAILENQIDRTIEDENLKKMRISNINKRFLCTRKSDCFAGVTSFTINEDGDIYPCVFTLGEPKFIIGNVMSEERINNNKLDSIFKEIKNEYNDCDNCQAQERCTGNQCKLLNYMITGKYNVPPTINCRLMEVELNTYKKLDKGNMENAE